MTYWNTGRWGGRMATGKPDSEETAQHLDARPATRRST
jgi:hypothetical protein